MVIIMDAIEVDSGFEIGSLRLQVLRRKMVFAVLVMQLVIRVVFVGAFLSFLRSEHLEIVQVMGAFVVWALVDYRVFANLPFAESVTTMRTKIFGFAFAPDTMANAQGIADFAPDLRSFLPSLM